MGLCINIESLYKLYIYRACSNSRTRIHNTSSLTHFMQEKRLDFFPHFLKHLLVFPRGIHFYSRFVIPDDANRNIFITARTLACTSIRFYCASYHTITKKNLLDAYRVHFVKKKDISETSAIVLVLAENNLIINDNIKNYFIQYKEHDFNL